MQIEVTAGSALRVETPCLVLPIWQGEELSDDAAELNGALNGLINEIINEDGFKGAAGDTRVVYTSNANQAERVVLVGLGKRGKMSTATLRKAVAKVARVVRSIKRDAFVLTLPAIDGLDTETIAGAVTDGILLGLHICNEYKTGEEARSLTEVANVTLFTDDFEAAQRGVNWAKMGATASIRARAWVNRPSNLKSPQYLAEQAQDIAEEFDLRCEIWDENRILDEGMGALWGVGMGSDNPPRFIIIEHAPEGTENDAPLILVGKGMSYDTGGYSLKPSTSMEDMKDDMGGAAAVLGAMAAVGEWKPQRRILAIVPSAENMVSGRAQRPGDIVTARNGKTIEVLNTDAEGRLILADALSYACEQSPALIVDLATLTGAIGIALGQEAAGLFANDDEIATALTAAGETTGERLWRFPMWDEYRDHVKGTISDIKNLGIERRAGSIAGAVFLEHFVTEGVRWAHLDIAAVAFVRDNRPLTQRGATGFGVRLLLEFLRAVK